MASLSLMVESEGKNPFFYFSILYVAFPSKYEDLFDKKLNSVNQMQLTLCCTWHFFMFSFFWQLQSAIDLLPAHFSLYSMWKFKCWDFSKAPKAKDIFADGLPHPMYLLQACLGLSLGIAWYLILVQKLKCPKPLITTVIFKKSVTEILKPEVVSADVASIQICICQTRAVFSSTSLCRLVTGRIPVRRDCELWQLLSYVFFQEKSAKHAGTPQEAGINHKQNACTDSSGHQTYMGSDSTDWESARQDCAVYCW